MYSYVRGDESVKNANSNDFHSPSYSFVSCRDDGTIDFPKFLTTMVRNMRDTADDEDIQLAFGMFDQDGNGFISVDELRNLEDSQGEKFADEEVDEMLSVADTDGDDQISYEGI